MTLKSLIVFVLLTITLAANSQDIIYWSGSSVNGNWDYGNGCTTNAGGNWYWNSSGIGDRSRPDCYASFNKIHFDNGINTSMNLNSPSDFNANQIIFTTGTPDRVINTDASKSIYFQNNNGNCKIENYVAGTTHTFNVPVFVNSGGNNMEINPVNGFLNFTNKITNNSNNPVAIYGFQQVTFSGDITGTPGVTINNNATVVYSGTSKTYSGTTTINTGTKLKISSNQTLGAIALNGGTLQVDAGITLTITGTYTATGGIIDNKGTIKFAGGSVTFPGNATINNGVANTLTNFEASSSGTVTLNSILNVTSSITVSAGTLLLGGYNLHLNNATLNISAGATFDNGGENQIINGGSAIINISGTFITRDTQGFVGTNTAIPNITPVLNPESTIEYGSNGDQAVQGSRSYFNLTFSNSGTKTLSSAITNTNTITGTVTIKDSAILDVDNKSFGGLGTNLTMMGISEFKTAGTGVKPDIGKTYTLGVGTKITFTNTAGTLESIRLSPVYYNIDIVGTSVGTNTATGAINFQLGGTLTVKSSGTFKLSNTAGFTGATNTSISNVNNPTITLETGSTIEYAGTTQNITPFSPAYSNLTVSGTGIKTTTAKTINVSNDLNITAAQLTINDGQTFLVANKVNNSGGIFIIENNGSLVQVNDNAVNIGNITYKRITPPVLRTDYTYWSSPVAGYTLGGVSKNLTLWDKYYSYNSLSETWKQESSATVMTAGTGYIIRGNETEPTLKAYDTFFMGMPNNGAYFITGIMANKPYLLGNPYPSALDADTFLADNSGVLEGTLYFWTHKTPLNLAENITNPGLGWVYTYSLNDYAAYNLTGGVGINDALLGTGGFSAPNGGAIPTGKIASGQGFFASSKTTISGTDIAFNNSMRVGVVNLLEEDNSQFFKTRNTKEKKAQIIEKHRVWLDLTNAQGVFKQTLIGYITDATNEYDSLFDGESFDGNEFVDFYSVNQNKNLVIQGRALPFDENDEVSLGYRTKFDGVFTINIDQTDGFLTNQDVFIEDKLANTVFDLKNGNYSFTTEKGVFNDRFVLRYINKTLRNNDLKIMENLVLVSNKNRLITVNSLVEPIETVFVYNLLGRQIFKKEKVDSNELTTAVLISGQQTLFVEVKLKNGQILTKKIVH